MTEAARPASPPRGLFISFEGTEGCGKTTQMRLLVDGLRRCGFAVTSNQEPGATSIGRQIRRLLLDPAHQEMSAMTELLLMFASRAQAASEIILPALARGDVVVSDRFTDSTLAYQGAGRGLGFDTVLKAHRIAVGSLYPHLTLCIAVDVETGLNRAHHRNQTTHLPVTETRLDQQSLEFHLRVSAGYQKIAQLEPSRFRMVNGEGDIVSVGERVWAEVNPLLCKTYDTQNTNR
ncbi:MAG: dTMP kinase [Acidobacteriaceae bacterium]|nr:dTMP kinase [Acidobacteriaceae bacterium]MBV9294207.1 dTMP kinase [Acidobacteriaceae bacterium]MBV9766071.1 dTMP kinase [Acidobacteriaceae bacterium]